MYNIEKLEQQWLHYRRKKIIFSTIIGLLALTGVAAVVSLIDMNGRVTENNASVPRAGKSISTPLSSERKEGTQKKSAAGKLDILSTEVPSLSASRNTKVPKAGQIIFQDPAGGSGAKAEKRKNLLIQVTGRGGKKIATDIENRFEFAKDKDDSLFLAKYYYDKMDYSKSEKWALETNRLDSGIEESWLIFAKSLAKQGKRVESLKVLKAFWDLGGSMKAKSLMDKIRRGKSF